MASLFVLNAAHLHLVLNHVPTIGAVVALGLLLLAFLRGDQTLRHVGLEVLFLVALLTLPVYVTGVAAYKKLPTGPEITDTAIRLHQDAALWGFTIMELSGFAAWIALWQTRRRGRPGAGSVAGATVLLVIALAAMARTATLGGEIHHPEIREEIAAGTAGPATSASQFQASAISHFMVYSTWAWPAAETVHFLGLSLSFGVLLAVNLRILGVMRQVPFADVHELLPWGMLGFGANLITGMLFFIGQPGQYIASSPFYWKIVFLMIAGANFLYLTVFRKGWADGGLESRLVDKAMAISSLFAWLAVLYAGRMLPFLGNAF